MSIAFYLANVVGELFDDPYTALVLHQLQGQQVFLLVFFYEIQFHSDYKARRLNRA